MNSNEQAEERNPASSFLNISAEASFAVSSVSNTQMICPPGINGALDVSRFLEPTFQDSAN